MNVEDIIVLLRKHQSSLHASGVVSVSLFGSVVRGESHSGSDIDILVEFGHPVGLFEFVRLKAKLEEILDRPVDLVTRDALHPAMRDSILAEAVHAA